MKREYVLTVIPLDAEGNVDIGALPISDAVKYDAKKLLNQWVKEYKRCLGAAGKG